MHHCLLLATACTCHQSVTSVTPCCASLVLVFVRFEALYAGHGTVLIPNPRQACNGCRSELANADAEQADEKEDDLVKGFKVANFEIIESPDKGTCMAAATSAP